MLKLVVIDFCGTIANYQTLDPFFEMILKEERKVAYVLFCNIFFKKILSLMNKLLCKFGYKRYIWKELMINALRGVSEDKFYRYGRQYYLTKIRNNLINETIDLILKLQKEGCLTMIVSGGSRYYIQPLADELKINGVLSAEIGFKDGKCIGKLINECLGEEKVLLLDAYLSKKRIKVQEKIGITDSPSDIPILNICDRKIIISYKVHQSWLTKDMEEIIWE